MAYDFKQGAAVIHVGNVPVNLQNGIITDTMLKKAREQTAFHLSEEQQMLDYFAQLFFPLSEPYMELLASGIHHMLLGSCDRFALVFLDQESADAAWQILT